MPTISPFTPQPGKTVNIVPSAASSNVLVSSGAGQQVRVINTTSATAFIAFGASTVTASSTTDMPIMAVAFASGSNYNMFTIPLGSTSTYMAAMIPGLTSATATTAAIYVTPGEGF